MILYDEYHVDVRQSYITLKVCRECGAIVGPDKELHTRFHDDLHERIRYAEG